MGRQASTRFIVATVVAVGALAGCLFPSFDGLKGTGKAEPDDDDDTVEPGKDGGASGTSSSSSSGTSGSTTSSTSSASSSGGNPVDSGVDSSKPPVFPKQIKCDSETCTPGQTVCCGPVIGPDSDCLPPAELPGHPCGGIHLFCDGAEECGAGELCCFENGEGRCKAGACNGVTLCDPTAAPCPAGKTCKGGFGVPGVKSCQP